VRYYVDEDYVAWLKLIHLNYLLENSPSIMDTVSSLLDHEVITNEEVITSTSDHNEASSIGMSFGATLFSASLVLSLFLSDILHCS